MIDMKFIPVLALAASLVFTPALADNHEGSQAAVKAAIEAYWAARAAKDATAVADLESRSGSLGTNSDGSFHKPLIVSTAESWAKNMKISGGLVIPFFIETTELSPTIVYARYYAEGMTGEGSRVVPYRSRVTSIWIKEKDGKWRMKSSHFSSAAFGGTHVTVPTDFED